MESSFDDLGFPKTNKPIETNSISASTHVLDALLIVAARKQLETNEQPRTTNLPSPVPFGWSPFLTQNRSAAVQKLSNDLPKSELTIDQDPKQDPLCV